MHFRPPAGHWQRCWAAVALLALVLGCGPRPASAAPSAEDLVNQAIKQMRQDPEASRRSAELAVSALQAHPDPDMEIRARLVLCDYQSERNASGTEAQLEAISALLPLAKRQALRAGALNCRGAMNEMLGNNAEALSLYEQAVSTAQSLRDNEMLADALFSRGYLLGLQGDYANGLNDLRRSRGLYESLSMPMHAQTVLDSIATTYNRMGDYAQAQAIYRRSLEVQRAAGMRREQVVTEHNLARVAENLHEWDSAHESFESALQLSREISYPRGEAYALRGLAAVALANGDVRTAMKDLDLASTIQQRVPEARLGALIALARGNALRTLGRAKEARAELVTALEIFRRADSPGDLALTYDALAGVDADLADWRRAFQWKEAAMTTTERLLRNQIDQRFATLKVEFDTFTKEKENLALQRTNQANGLALAQTRRAQQLQVAVIVLTAVLALMLASLALYQRRASLRMRQLAMTDELTGVPNRRAVLARLGEVIASKEEHKSTAVMIFDIDHFKRINDEYGHPVGDRVLCAVTASLRGVLQPPSFFGRVGGEEFLVVIPACTAERAMAVAEQLRSEVCTIDTSEMCPQVRLITASIGVTLSSPGDTTSTILHRADAALYRAKRAGRNCVILETLKQPPRAVVEVEANGSLGENGVVVNFRQGKPG